MTHDEPIESYALLGDTHTAALVDRTGSIDWLCLPRFDSPACFAALLGVADDGHWRIAPAGAQTCNRRQYRGDTLILETEWETTGGKVKVIDFMPPRGEAPDVVRIVEGVSGRVDMVSELRIRFDYGTVVPWLRQVEGGLHAIAGPDSVHLRTPIEMEGRDYAHVGQFTVSAGDRVPFVLTWTPSHHRKPKSTDAERALKDTIRYWAGWMNNCAYDGEWRDIVVRSLITLKSLTYSPTGGIAAAATTSLPEALGGERNWDYRFCWLRDASMTLQTLLYTGFRDEARAWREWLLRAIAGDPAQIRIMYGLSGERRIPEYELSNLRGYAESRPVRIGNAASDQFQLDVYGEVLDALHLDRCADLAGDDVWPLQRGLLRVLEERWNEPDQGLWEIRGEPQHFVHSKVMAWTGFDRAVRAVERFGVEGPVAKWRALRDEIHSQICKRGFDEKQNSFVQAYGSKALDAATLLLPTFGFIDGTDDRFVGTVDAIERQLMHDGFLLRYEVGAGADDGFESEEGSFVACTLWFADALHLSGRVDEAREVFERVLDVRNDVGLIAEEYDPRRRRQLGNVPQAYSHLGVVNMARALSRHGENVGRVHRHEPLADLIPTAR